MEFFRSLTSFPSSRDFVSFDGLAPRESEEAWFAMILFSPELLMIRPLRDTASLEFLGKFIRYALNTKRGTGLAFDLDVVAACFSSGRSKLGVKEGAQAVRRGFEAFYHPESRVKIEMRTLPCLIYHGTSSSSPELVFPMKMMNWSELSLKPFEYHEENVVDDEEVTIFHIRRAHLVDYSLLAMGQLCKYDSKVNIIFVGEDGQDGGGLFN